MGNVLTAEDCLTEGAAPTPGYIVYVYAMCIFCLYPVYCVVFVYGGRMFSCVHVRIARLVGVDRTMQRWAGLVATADCMLCT